MATITALAAWFAVAQGTTSLRGVVTDDGGGAIPGAAVTLVNTATSASRSTLTDDSGVYQFLQAAPGKYEIKVEKPGFRTMMKNDLPLQVSTPATLDMKLEVGSLTESVNVVADVTAINTVDATIGNPFNETQVRSLPLQTRNVVELLSIQPGVTPTGEVLGARRDQNNVTLDGVDANDNQNSGINATTSTLTNGSNANGVPGEAGFNAALPVPLDSVQEFRVTVGGQGADQGRSSGGQVTLITKSGSNQYHGSLYEFNRNTATTANNWFSNRAGVAREALVRNQFGGSVGGRIIRDRAFFFLNYEQRIDASAQARTRNVPTESLKQGILTFRLSDGSTQRLTPADIKNIDPLGRGVSPAMLQYLSFYPQGNDSSAGADRGLNFMGYRFNAPFRQEDKAYVAKFDFNLDQAGMHTLSWRGTLADNAQDVQVAQFPGQDPAAKLLNNSKGFAARYTAVVSPTIINVLSVGLTRLGLEQSGTVGPQLQFDGVDAQVDYRQAARGFARRSPTWNIADAITWNKGSHTIGTGANLRFIRFDRTSSLNAFPNYQFGRNTLLGLGSDINTAVLNYVRERTGNPTVTLADGANVTRGMGVLFGLLNSYGVTYNFDKTGNAIPLGTPVARNFATNEYEFYVQDTWRATSELTLTYGVRYANFTPPYETNGIQVGTTVGMDQFFAERVGAMLSGVSNATTPNALLTYDLNGPANGRDSWYRRDNNNFAPRFSFAYSPQKDGLLSSIMGKGSVFRGGFGVAYDRFGSDLITEFDRTGSPGLATALSQPLNSDFTTGVRYPDLPALPTTTSGAFPFTPAPIVGGFGSGVGIDPSLVAPYSFLINTSYARDVKGITVEVGYAGRLSRKNLIQVDTFQPLTRFVDKVSGQDWAQMSGALRDAYENGITPAMVRANPGALPLQPWIENLAPGLQDNFFAGSATANYFDMVYNKYALSDLDALNDIDRIRSTKFPNCILVTGCNTVFAPQNAGNRTWMNVGFANYHAGTLSIRRPMKNGVGFDFNYTLSHSIDNSSASESGAGNGGAIVQDSFDYGAFRGSSDFDIRHNITANGIYELPFGKGKAFGSNVPTWVNQFIGGWQVNVIARYRSGLPTTIQNGGVYPTNYLTSAIAILRPGATAPETGQTYNQNGNPSVFGDSATALKSYMGQYPGRTGARAIARLDDMMNFDLAAAKVFTLPFEGHRVLLRGEAFNAFNNVNFFYATLRMDRPAQFGEFQRAMPARVMQFALRYEF